MLVAPTPYWSENEEYVSAYGTVWSKVKETHLDPTFGSLSWPVAQLCTPDGTVPDGRGVVLDMEVGLDREMLLMGIVSQPESAIRKRCVDEHDSGA